jgi:hypothetical protein
MKGLLAAYCITIHTLHPHRYSHIILVTSSASYDQRHYSLLPSQSLVFEAMLMQGRWQGQRLAGIETSYKTTPRESVDHTSADPPITY